MAPLSKGAIGRMDGKHVSIFYSYSHKDEKLRDHLQKHLSVLRRKGLISNWHDRCIDAGDEWRGQISEHLERAQIILLLVSAEFLASDYCYDIEMKRAMARHDQGLATVIPVLLRDVDWTDAPFGKLQALPTDAYPVTSRKWKNRDEAFAIVARGIKAAVTKINSNTIAACPTAAATTATSPDVSRRTTGLLKNAVQAEITRMTALDPRFDVRLSATSSDMAWTLHAKEPVTVFLSGKPTAMIHLREAIRTGKAIKFSADELHIDGSPLFQEPRLQSIAFDFSQSVPAVVTLQALGEDGQPTSVFHAIQGNLVGGTHQCTFRTSTPGSPLELSIPITADPNLRAGNVQAQFSLEPWLGKEITRLPYFDELFAIFGLPDHDAKFSIECKAMGSTVCRGTITIHSTKFRKWIQQALLAISKARAVCHSKAIVVELPRDFTEDDVADIEMAFQLVTHGQWKRQGRTVSVSTVMSKDAAKALANQMKAAPEEKARLRLPADGKIPFLRTDLSLGPLEHTITDVALDLSPQRNGEGDDLTAGIDDEVVRWCGTESTMIDTHPRDPKADDQEINVETSPG